MALVNKKLTEKEIMRQEIHELELICDKKKVELNAAIARWEKKHNDKFVPACDIKDEFDKFLHASACHFAKNEIAAYNKAVIEYNEAAIKYNEMFGC